MFSSSSNNYFSNVPFIHLGVHPITFLSEQLRSLSSRNIFAYRLYNNVRPSYKQYNRRVLFHDELGICVDHELLLGKPKGRH